MSRRPPSLEELEALLIEVGAELDFPITDLAPKVVGRLAVVPSEAPPRRTRPRSIRWLVAATLIVICAGAAVSSWLGVRGVRITEGPAPSNVTPVQGPLDLGERVPMKVAQESVGFQLLRSEQLGDPDEVHMQALDLGTQIFFLYRMPSPEGRVEVVISQFEAGIDEEWLHKYVDNGPIEPVRVGDGDAFWILAGHGVGYVDASGRPIDDRVRLAGNVLLWEQGSVTLRLEGPLTKWRAIRIARSFE